MGIFNQDLVLKVSDIYNIEEMISNAQAFTAMMTIDTNIHHEHAYFPLCSVRISEYNFYKDLNYFDFTKKLINSFKDCTIGNFQDINKQISELGDISAKFDTIHDFMKVINSGQYIDRETILLSFPHFSTTVRGQGLLDYHWGILYTFIENRIYLITFPLIPKEGCPNIF